MKRFLLICFSVFILCSTAYYYWPEQQLDTSRKVTKIIVHKSIRTMNVYAGNTLLKTYSISLGKNPVGDKAFEGDNKTPEGAYMINDKNPNSVCYKNLGISYPDKSDIKYSKNLGKKTGGDIKIHGLPDGQGYFGKFHRFKDWTNGCIAVTNDEMDELYSAVDIGTPIIIKP